MAQEIITRTDSTEIAEADLFQPVGVFDLERFETVMRVATVMARATTIPAHLRSTHSNPEIAFEETRGNCFVVCNLACNWGMDPFAVAQATSIVFGKMVLEGKLVRAAIAKKLGFDLHYQFFGVRGKMDRRVYVSDRPLVDHEGNPLPEDKIIALMTARVSYRITMGTLEKWHTKNKNGGINDNWAKDEDKMFRERGAREWCREWEPGLMLGVYTPDEFDDIDQTRRSNMARDISYNPLLENNAAPAVNVTTKQAQPETVSSAAAERVHAADPSGGKRPDLDSHKSSAAASSSSQQTSSPAETAAEPSTPSTPAIGSAASTHAMSADQLIKAARFLARQADPDALAKAAAAIKAGGETQPKPSEADLNLLRPFKEKVEKALRDGSNPMDDLDAFIAEVEQIFGLNDFPGDQ